MSHRLLDSFAAAHPATLAVDWCLLPVFTNLRTPAGASLTRLNRCAYLVREIESRTVGKGHVTTVRAKGQLTIPADVRDAVHLEEGDPVEVEIVEGGILLRPLKLIDAAQAWFWTPEWQAGEREASAERAAGQGTRYESAEDFLDSWKP